MTALVSVLVLNYRQRAFVPPCLDVLMRQSYRNVEIVFIDNASGDGTAEYVSMNYPEVRVISNSSNLYYCKAHNGAIRQAKGNYIMPLNVDVIAGESYIEQMVRAMELDDAAGAVSGKLLQMDADLRPLAPAVFDSAGLYFSPELRHFDRGSQQPDCGQYDRMEYIFGASGAAPLYRREMLEDISFEGEFFDEDFVIYREDADLAWRAQLLGWKAIYAPLAVALHLRKVRPTADRRQIDPDINMHSVKNRFLMRIKNQSIRNGLRLLLPVTWRDLQVIGYVLLVEHSSLRAFPELVRLLPRALRKRRDIMKKKRASERYIASWFSYKPTSYPLATGGEN